MAITYRQTHSLSSANVVTTLNYLREYMINIPSRNKKSDLEVKFVMDRMKCALVSAISTLTSHHAYLIHLESLFSLEEMEALAKNISQLDTQAAQSKSKSHTSRVSSSKTASNSAKAPKPKSSSKTGSLNSPGSSKKVRPSLNTSKKSSASAKPSLSIAKDEFKVPSPSSNSAKAPKPKSSSKTGSLNSPGSSKNYRPSLKTSEKSSASAKPSLSIVKDEFKVPSPSSSKSHPVDDQSKIIKKNEKTQQSRPVPGKHGSSDGLLSSVEKIWGFLLRNPERVHQRPCSSNLNDASQNTSNASQNSSNASQNSSNASHNSSNASQNSSNASQNSSNASYKSSNASEHSSHTSKSSHKSSNYKSAKSSYAGSSKSSTNSSKVSSTFTCEDETIAERIQTNSPLTPIYNYEKSLPESVKRARVSKSAFGSDKSGQTSVTKSIYSNNSREGRDVHEPSTLVETPMSKRRISNPYFYGTNSQLVGTDTPMEIDLAPAPKKRKLYEMSLDTANNISIILNSRSATNNASSR